MEMDDVSGTVTCLGYRSLGGTLDASGCLALLSAQNLCASTFLPGDAFITLGTNQSPPRQWFDILPSVSVQMISWILGGVW